MDTRNCKMCGKLFNYVNSPICPACTKEMDKKFEELAINLANDFNLMLCGIDIIASDISNYDLGYHIIEINSSPGLDNYLYPKSKQNKYVESLYSMIFDELSI